MQTLKLLKYQLRDVLRSKWLLFYGLFFLLATEGLFRFGGAHEETLLSLLNLTLLFIPLVSMIFGMLYLYNTKEFMILMLSQPIDRKSMFWGSFLGVGGPLALAFIIGLLLPFTWYGIGSTTQVAALVMLLISGTFLTLIFTALAFWIGISYLEERVKGMGFGLLVWLLFALVYDGIVLLLTFMYGDYPLEKPMIAVSLLNPIDLARILLLLEFDISALMGYTGAVFNRFFGSQMGFTVASSFLLIWLLVPTWRGLQRFKLKDF